MIHADCGFTESTPIVPQKTGLNEVCIIVTIMHYRTPVDICVKIVFSGHQFVYFNIEYICTSCGGGGGTLVFGCPNVTYFTVANMTFNIDGTVTATLQLRVTCIL